MIPIRNSFEPLTNLRFVFIRGVRYVFTINTDQPVGSNGPLVNLGGSSMKTWTKPAVREQEVGLEVTSYLPAEIDVI